MGLDDPRFSESDSELLAALLEGSPGGIGLEELESRGFAKTDLGFGPAPHAEGRFGTADGRLPLSTRWLDDAGIDPLPHYDPPAEVADAELAERYPLAMITPKTHLFLNSTFANQSRQHGAQPEPFVVVHPDDAAARGLVDGDRTRVFNGRGSFVCPARVSDDARRGVLVAPMGWWSGDYEDGVGGQVTTSQRLTRLGNAPTFNDNRVEAERA